MRRLQAKAPLREPVRVVVADGRYTLPETLTFSPDDSGSENCPIVYQAAPGASPVISGGRVVTGWQEQGEGIWMAPSPVENTRQLYVDGQRAVRARGPVPAGLELCGDAGYRTRDLTVLQWRNITDIEFCYLVVWSHSRCKIASIQPDSTDKTLAVIQMQQPTFTMARTKEGVQVVLPDYVENAFQLLNEAGEWYLDRPASTIYYKPRPGEDLTKARTVVPALETLVEIRGTLERPVRNITFQNLTLADAAWLQPSRSGHADVQANFLNDPAQPLTRDGLLTTIHNEQLKSPANVICRHAESILFDRCTFTRLGGAGLDIEHGSRLCHVTDCRFFDISGSAIQIGDVLREDHHPTDERRIVRDNSVRKCLIQDCCVEYKGGVGVFVGYTQGTTVANNEIRDLPYSGVSVGWGWGEEDAGGGAYKVQGPFYEQPTACRDNRVTNNHIHHVMRELQDGGAIYTLGNQPGTLIAGNHIHDNCGVPGGIYLDEGSGLIEITGNSVYRVPTAMNYNNRVQDRIKTCPEHGNYFDLQPPPPQLVAQAGIAGSPATKTAQQPQSTEPNGGANRARRVIYNFDGDSCLSTKAGSKGPVAVTVEDVKRLIEEVAYDGSQVETVLVCVNAQVMYYPTQVGTMRGTLSSADERAKWPESEKQRFQNLQAFFANGVDPYAIMLAETKRRGREALLTFRMNDDHGNDFLRTQILMDHPEWRLGTEQYRGKGAMDFGRDEVREYTFRLIEEAVRRYDCDGIELDFNRFPAFFKEGTTDERVAKMNSLVERVRRLLDDVGRQRGRRLLLAARVPSNYGRTPPTPETSLEIGCDVPAWARKGWVDFVTVSEFLIERGDLPIGLWKQAITNVPVYGGIECTKGSGQQNLTADEYRHAAANLLKAGADGVYLFNFFTSREGGADACEPPFEVLRDLTQPQP